MRRIRKLLLTLGITATLMLALPLAASADPGDGGGFSDPTITTPVGTITVSGPNGGATVALAPRITTSAADPGDGGGF